MKIHIIGCSGSGKSYLARHLSENYQIPTSTLMIYNGIIMPDSMGSKCQKKNEVLCCREFYKEMTGLSRVYTTNGCRKVSRMLTSFTFWKSLL